MPKDFPRTYRIAEQIQRELAGLIRMEIRDPRVGNITVSGVEVTKDLGHAKVFVTELGKGEEDTAPAIEALNHASGFLRRQLGRMLKLRTIPQLHFHYDPSFDRGARLSALIDEALEEDKERHQDQDED